MIFFLKQENYIKKIHINNTHSVSEWRDKQNIKNTAKIIIKWIESNLNFYINATKTTTIKKNKIRKQGITHGRRKELFLKNQAWSVAYQKKQKNKNASIRKLNDNCGVINEMQGVS